MFKTGMKKKFLFLNIYITLAQKLVKDAGKQ
jgi:hypothetical protein